MKNRVLGNIRENILNLCFMLVNIAAKGSTLVFMIYALARAKMRYTAFLWLVWGYLLFWQDSRQVMAIPLASYTNRLIFNFRTRFGRAGAQTALAKIGKVWRIAIFARVTANIQTFRYMNI